MSSIRRTRAEWLLRLVIAAGLLLPVSIGWAQYAPLVAEAEAEAKNDDSSDDYEAMDDEDWADADAWANALTGDQSSWAHARARCRLTGQGIEQLEETSGHEAAGESIYHRAEAYFRYRMLVNGPPAPPDAAITFHELELIVPDGSVHTASAQLKVSIDGTVLEECRVSLDGSGSLACSGAYGDSGADWTVSHEVDGNWHAQYVGGAPVIGSFQVGVEFNLWFKTTLRGPWIKEADVPPPPPTVKSIQRVELTVPGGYTLELPPLPQCEGDTDGNGAVDVTDLLAVLGKWGLCP